MPIDKNSTQLLSLSDIDTSRIDLYEDAFGFDHQFDDIIGLLNATRSSLISDEQLAKLTGHLFDKIRNKTI